MTINDSLDLLLAEIDLLKAELQLHAHEITPALQKNLDIDYTHDSNALEGSSLNLAETDMVIRNGLMLPGKPMGENLTALNHYQTIHFIRDQAREQNLLSASLLQKLHIMLSRGVQHQIGGAFRSQEGRLIGGQTAPPPEQIAHLLETHLHWLNLEGPFLHPVVFAAEAHFRLLSLLPFQNYNGLCARLLMNLVLLSEGFPVLNIVANRVVWSDYTASFNAAQTGEPQAWQAFIAKQAVLNAQNLLHRLEHQATI
ncbi:Fic family protein [Methylomonas sp. SURF-2]|uniref:Fic family protein n=1 Tax=Methylomonas subterranea TaxID=2952225 RepID=A0ABT1TDV1_9GAMM|nr:Fic family protein [Methylomonas sp. SURF-2]MCQ8103464.1 Fic family protein [Methylomonas sp. SURF-2]